MHGDAGAGYTVGSPNSAGVTVADDDSAPTPLPPATPELPHVTIAAAQGSVTEGQTATFTVTANPAPAADVQVSVTVTATGGDHGVSSGARNLTIPAGAGQPTATLEVTTVDDTIDESNGTVTARLNPGTGYTVAGTNPARVTVADNDETVVDPVDPVDPPPGGKPTVSITSVSPNSVTEGGTVTVTLTASPAPTERIEGSVIFADSYADGSSRSAFSFGSGETTDQPPSFTSQDDGQDVPSRTLTIFLYAFDDSYAVSSGTRTVTINDGDGD